MMIGPAKVEKRNRPPKSCEPCRTRKLKCNRALPCDSCVRRHKQSQCYYASNADRNEKPADKVGSVAGRLKTLEDLIATIATASPALGSDGRVGLTPNEADINRNVQFVNYAPERNMNSGTDVPTGLMGHVDSNHWSSILENIRAIRDELPASSPQTSTLSSATLNNEPSENMDLDLRTSEGLTMQQVLSTLPPRQVCDTLVSVFFRSHYSMMPILHPVKFQQEYEAFWDSPSETSATWIAMLLALLSLTAGAYELSGQARTSQVPIPSSKVMSQRTEECLLLSNYTASNEHGVEALLLLLVGRWLRAKISDTNLWFLMGKVVQLAICKGYHRDSAKVPGSNISPFDGEMRRRVWVCLYQLDSLMSFQMGLPSMIPSDCCDTELPRNLSQSDFYPGISELPPSRPLSENTTILYSIVKASVMAMFKKVVKHTRSLVPPPYNETVSLDSEVRLAYDNIPEIFKYKPLTSFIVEDVSVITHRTTIELLYLKSIIVLHREHLTNPQDSQSAFSRRACLEAAVRLLERQVELHRVTQPGGLLHDMKWMVTSLTLSDFILAAMVICLDLTLRIRQGVRVIEHNEEEDFQKYLAAVQKAHQIWTASSETSEGRTVAHAIDSTVQRVNESMVTRSLSTSSQIWPASTTSNPTPDYLTQDASEQITDLNVMDSIDWSLLDNQIQDPSIQDFELDLWLMDTAGPLGP